MLPFSAFIITRDQYLQSSEHLQLLSSIKMWYHWYNTKTSDPFYFREHCCTHGPTSVPPPLSMTQIFSQNFVECHLILPLSLSRSLPNSNSCRYCYRKKIYKITYCIKLIFCYNVLQIHSNQWSFSHLHGWELSTFPPGAPVRAGQLGSLMQLCPVLPQNPKHYHCYTISIYFFVIVVLGSGRGFSKGPVVMDT